MTGRAGESASAAAESAIERIRGLNERIVELARQGGEQSLKAYENTLENLAQTQEAAGTRGADWVQAITQAQASFTRELANALPGALQQLGARAKDAGEAAAAQARQVAGVADAEGEARGAFAREEDLPIRDYDQLRVEDITEQLDGMSGVDLGKIDAYERRTRDRKTVLDKIRSLRS